MRAEPRPAASRPWRNTLRPTKLTWSKAIPGTDFQPSPVRAPSLMGFMLGRWELPKRGAFAQEWNWDSGCSAEELRWGSEAAEAAAWDPMVSGLHRARDTDPALICSTRPPLQQFGTPGVAAEGSHLRLACRFVNRIGLYLFPALAVCNGEPAFCCSVWPYKLGSGVIGRSDKALGAPE